jgi:hypothetical protein
MGLLGIYERSGVADDGVAGAKPGEFDAARKYRRKQANQGGGRFLKGVSGNPRGKLPGARHATTIMAEQLMEGEAEVVVRAVVAKAKQGDMRAARLVLDRIAPLRRGRPVTNGLPDVRTARPMRAKPSAW